MRGQIFVTLFVIISLIVLYSYYHISLYNKSVAEFEKAVDSLYTLDFSNQEYFLETKENVIYLSLLASINSSSVQELEQKTKELVMGQYNSYLGTKIVPYEDYYNVSFFIPGKNLSLNSVRINVTGKHASEIVYMPFLELVSLGKSFDWDSFDFCLLSYDCLNYTEGLNFCLSELSNSDFSFTFDLKEPPCVANKPKADIFVYKNGNLLTEMFSHYVGSV